MYPLYACRVCFHRVLHRIFSLWPLLYSNCLHFALPLVFYSTSLLSYLIIPWVFPAWYHLLYIYLLLLACAHDTVFNACLWFRFIDTRVLIYARHLAFASPLAGEFWLAWILMSRSWSLERVDSPSCWSEWRIWGMDPSRPPEPYPSRLLVRLLSFPSVNSWAPFVLFILVCPFVFSHLRLSVM